MSNDKLTDILRGGKAIAEYLGLPEYQVYRMIEAKHIQPATSAATRVQC
jgi:hypothetical protein